MSPRRSGSFVAIAALSALLTLCGAAPARAQRTDSTRVGAQRPRADTVTRTARVDTATRLIPRPPLTPRRAFLYSLALPGYAQSRLGRPTAGAIFVVAEAIGIAMLRESNAELQQALRLRSDSVVVIGYDPSTGAPITTRPSFNDELINVRRGHREDWVAALIANHFFAGADAYVAAHLWDLPAQVAVKQTGHGTVVAAKVPW